MNNQKKFKKVLELSEELIKLGIYDSTLNCKLHKFKVKNLAEVDYVIEHNYYYGMVSGKIVKVNVAGINILTYDSYLSSNIQEHVDEEIISNVLTELIFQLKIKKHSLEDLLKESVLKSITPKEVKKSIWKRIKSIVSKN